MYPGMAPRPPPVGKLRALAGLACFKFELYDAAARQYRAAIQAGGAQVSEWREMLALAEANAIAEIDVCVPKPTYFTYAPLVARPSVRHGHLPRPPKNRRGDGCFKRLRLFLGEVLGAVLTVLMDRLTDWVGRKFGYRGKVWTNWYGRWLVREILTLAYMREQLTANNLRSTYPAGTLVGFQDAGQQPPLGVTHFRTADGSWNNLANPKEGAAGTRFLRNVNLSAVCPETATLLEPNPREVSLRLLTRPDGDDGRPHMTPVPFLNLLAASWIQFMVHDWVNHGEPQPNDFIKVPLRQGDPARARYGWSEMVIGRTQPDPTRNGPQEPATTSSINEVTHWWDGSQIYGSDQATQNRLRSHRFGKMKLNDDGTLPLDPTTGVEDAGFMRSWWVGLSMLHTLFVREHNAICDVLYEAYPSWDDDRLFNVARLINAAVMAKIHSIEWTPAILPNRALDTGLNSNWYGLLTYILRKGKARKTLSEVKIRNAELGGIVGNPINRHHCVFGLSEEFVEVYRLHSLLPETLEVRLRGQKDIEKKVPLPATRQHGSVELTKKYAISDLFHSFGNQHPGALVLNNFPRFMQELSVPGNPFFDVGTVDIVRARERGVPRYNAFRRQLGLNQIRSFDDLTDDRSALKNLRSVYGDNPDKVEDLDLLVGTLAEGRRPSGFGFGETLFQIFILNASRRLQADRFYTDCYNEDVYTPEGLRWVDQTDLKTVILRHYPELADTGLANIKNAFEPWDEGPELDLDRHPLREWDAELKHDPSRGDAYRHA
ncbi:peroxidase family protein [Mycobacterium senriense]|uniref:Peroxidase n=1 Tax=Mycobacterium senriense TaxID=2775496 RepID=A0ABM7SMK9_9MYCO|nr:peroxidase family protein [Mycobacterium senriense]BCZ21200.1 putative peroxidase [Mycobacterium senriense]